ncbi:MAG: hypothetical protein QM831_19275 [Kofleriaceae bacterium]
MRAVFITIIALVASIRIAHAYPQFQLIKDQTCSSCHLSPAGGGLLSENGYAVAESISQFGTAPEFMYKKVPLPDWLQLGGDFRGAGGYDAAGANKDPVVFPMQAEIYARATYKNFTLHVTAGLRDPEYQTGSPGYVPATLVGSREHYLQWQSDEGSSNGVFVRVGRFMPVFGLRFAEHPYYDRRYGGTPLYGETYAAAVEYVQPKYEVHLTGFVPDPLIDAIELGKGATLYAEARLDDKTAVGIEGKLDFQDTDNRYYGGITAKRAITGDILAQGEIEYIHDVFDGGHENQLVGTAVGSYLIGPAMIDLGLNYFRQKLDTSLLDLEAVDLNVHWFGTSHLELILANRYQTQAFGANAAIGQAAVYYSLLMVHYRL